MVILIMPFYCSRFDQILKTRLKTKFISNFVSLTSNILRTDMAYKKKSLSVCLKFAICLLGSRGLIFSFPCILHFRSLLRLAHFFDVTIFLTI